MILLLNKFEENTVKTIDELINEKLQIIKKETEKIIYLREIK